MKERGPPWPCPTGYRHSQMPGARGGDGLGARRARRQPGAPALARPEENPKRFGRRAVPLVPGDWGLLQYGLFSVFFQFAARAAAARPRSAAAISGRARGRQLVRSPRRLLRARPRAHHAPSLPKPAELSNPDEIAAASACSARSSKSLLRPPPGAENSGGTGVKDPGAHDTKKQGGGKKMADAEGKLGKNGKEDHTELPARSKMASVA